MLLYLHPPRAAYMSGVHALQRHLKLTKTSSCNLRRIFHHFPTNKESSATEMADRETSIVRKNDEELNRPSNPLSSLFSKFTQVFNFPFPPLPPARKDVKVETVRKTVVDSDEVVEEWKTTTITFPDARAKTVAPLKLESEEAEQETNPVVLWQYRCRNFFHTSRSPDSTSLIEVILFDLAYG